jgi:hypothetical protein
MAPMRPECNPESSPLACQQAPSLLTASRLSQLARCYGPQYHEEKPNPLPIDGEVPTCGCQLAIKGTGNEIGYLNIKDARIRDFLQPVILPEGIEIWPPGSRSEIGWLHYKGDPQKEPTQNHPFDYDADDWENPNNFYNIDLVVGKEKELEFVRNVMRKYLSYTTNSI